MKTKGEYTTILIWAKKLKAIKLLGGECEYCGDNNIFHLVFHHKKDKLYNINDIKSYRWDIIEKEIKKCSLLCHNCHNELHHPELDMVGVGGIEPPTLTL